MLTRDDLQKLSCRPDRKANSVFALYLNVASVEYEKKLERMLEEQKTLSSPRIAKVRGQAKKGVHEPTNSKERSLIFLGITKAAKSLLAQTLP